MASTRHPRSRTGCWICRLRKKKCDETKPTCQQCQNLKIQCDGYGASQPAWMRDPVAAKRKKDEIKLQIGKRGRRRRKNRPGKDLEAAKSVEGEVLLQQGDNGESKVILEDDTTTKTPGLLDAGGEKTGETQHFVFETIEGGIRLLKPFNETPGKSSSQAVTMLDSPCPPVGCFRCPVKNPFSTIARRGSGYSLLDTHTGKPLLQSIRSEVVIVATPPLQKPTKSTDPNTRTKEEEIDYDEYDVIITTFTSLSKRQTPFGLPDIPDPSLIPPVNLHELDLVKNYIRNVFRLTFSGMSETRIHKTLREVVVPLLCTNPGFVKGCMSSSAMHLAISNGESGPNFKNLLKDSWEHGIECVHGLRKMLEDEGASEQTLALILVLVSFEVPSPLSNWQLHLQAAIECLVQMDLLNRPTHTAITKFLMSRIIWLDILSALTLGRAPQLWANYREILSRPVHQRSCCGLLEMMGCDDTVMFLVSEVMCVEDYKFRTLDDGMISWTRGRKRAMELDIRLRDRDLPVAVKLPPSPEPPLPQLPPSDEDGDSTDDDDDDANSYLVSPSPSSAISDSQSPVPNEENHSNLHNTSPIPSSPAPTVAPLSPPTTSEGAVSKEKTTLNDADYHNDHSIPPELHPDEDMIVKATTAAFRTATRIHLWSIGLGFYPRLSFFQQLLEELTVMIALIPIKLSRVVAWPLLVGGCTAIKPKDREYFARRCTIGDGTLCGIAKIMREVWKRSDESDRSLGVGCGQEVHWRSIMREQGMEILLV